MIRFFAALTALIIFYFCYGIYVAQMDIEILPSEIKREHPHGFHDYRGAINVETNLSRGSAHPLQVIEEAQRAGLDFLILTDVNQFSQAESFNGYHDRVLVMSEAEYAFLDSRLLLVEKGPQRTLTQASEANLYLTDTLSQEWNQGREAMVILAHPFVRGQPTWTGAYPPGLHGIEILNPKAIGENSWLDSKLNVIWSLLTYPFNPKYAFLRLFREPIEETSLWDSISAARPFYGFAGADASARAVPLANYFVRFPSYQRSLEIVSNHILLGSELTGNFSKDRQKIYQAFRSGNFYAALDLLGDPRGFNAVLSDHDHAYLMGSRIDLKAGLVLTAKLGHQLNVDYELVLLKDGQRELMVHEPELNYEIKSPGVYRIVVRVCPTLPLPDGKKWMTWIYTNSFYVSALGRRN
ncbi:MAG: hypothetical protein C5B49_06360 [Bdellovibrio sp.]|nr:MAG: hypothetical protein C5B49_06360 [Bdellovibrio sp.]